MAWARRYRMPVVAMLAVVVLAGTLAAAGGAIAGGQPTSIGAVRPEDPSVSGPRVVWSDQRSGHYDVYAYDAITRTTKRLTSGPADHMRPSVSGDLVVWADYRNGDADIYCYDFATGLERPLVVAAGDQVSPSLSGKWLVYEDYSGGYTSAVKAYDVTGGSRLTIASNGKRPQIAGDLVVYEEYSTSRTDADVKARDLASGATYAVATGSNAQLLPATDGRYVAWAEGNGRDLDVRLYDTQTGKYSTAAAGTGEQSFPAVANGIVYSIDNKQGSRLHLDTFEPATGRIARYNDYGTEDVSAVSASGESLAWLAKSGTSWQVHATFGSGGLLATALSRLVPAPVPAVRLAQVSADADSPAIVRASVKRGALNVRDSSFTVYFSERLDPRSVTGSSVRLLDARGRAVRGRVRYSALAKAVTFTPARPLGGGTYTLAIAPSLADESGNTLGEPDLRSFSTIGILADTSAPYPVTGFKTKVYQGSKLWAQWASGVDDVGVAGYQLYRAKTPGVAIANLATDAQLIATFGAGATTGTVDTLAADELAKSFTYYYTMVAYDAANNTSTVGLSDAPDPHGMQVSGSTNLCSRCHSVHGNKPTMALGAKSAAACYECHGNTPETPSYAAASSLDVQADFSDDSAIATTGPSKADGSSVHRNAYMSSIQRECDACHTPHRKPWDADPSKSYNRLLRTQLSTGPASYRYNTDASAVGNQFCADCHGASATNIAIIGGDLAYSNTGGDHLANYGASAHRESMVPANNGGANPTVQCEACHSNHASATNKLIDYRDSETTTTANNQSGLCFKCHSASGAEAGKPNTWNARDVKIEFARASHHPYTAGTGEWVQKTNESVFSQTSQPDFQADTRFQTIAVATGDGAARLATRSVTTDPPNQPYLFFADAAPRFDALSPTSTVWNEDFTPTNITAPTTGANAVVKNGYIFAMAGTALTTIRTYLPPAGAGAGTWGNTATGLWQAPNAGSDMALDSSEGYIWALVGGYTPTAANSNIRRTTNFGTNALAWNPAGGAGGPYFMTAAGTPLALGAGSTLAWVPANGTRLERLYVVNKNGGTNANGVLYYYNSPDAASGGTTWTTTAQTLGTNGTTNDAGSRMAYFRIGTTDYLYFMRGGAANSASMVQLGNTNVAAVASIEATQNPWNTAGAIGEGASLAWNGVTTQSGFRLYAINGKSNVMKVATWTGSTLSWDDAPQVLDTPGAGSWLAYINADPPSATKTPYWNSGTVTGPEIEVPGTLQQWRTLTFNAPPVAGTSFCVKVQGSKDEGKTWEHVATATASPFDLSSVVATSFEQIRLVAQFTSGGGDTPVLNDWSVTADYVQAQSGAYVDTPDNTFAQDTQTELDAGDKEHTVVNMNDGNGAAELATHTATIVPTTGTYMYVMDPAALTMEEYAVAKGASGVWNEAFSPAADTGQFNSAAGSVLFALNNKVYRTRGGSTTSPMIRQYTPPNGSGTGAWGAAPILTMPAAFGAAAESAINTASSVVYISAGGGASSAIEWWQYSGTTVGSMNFYYNTTARTLGVGSGIAYSRAADRLWVVYKNGATGDGNLYYLGAPGIKTGNQTFTNTAVQVTNAASNYGRLAAFKNAAGTDFLAYIGKNSANGTDTVVLSNLGGTPVKTNTGCMAFGSSKSLGEGCELKWDGVPGGYLYALQGGGNALVARAKIPADPTVAGDWAWQRMTSLNAAANAGSGIAFAQTLPGQYTGSAYWTYGTLTSPFFDAPSHLVRWNKLTYGAQVPDGTNLSVKILGSPDGGATWSELATSTASTGGNTYDLSGISTVYKTLRLVGVFANQFITVVTKVFSQDVLSEFALDTVRNNTTVGTADGDGAATLATHTATLVPVQADYLYSMRANSLAMDEYNTLDDITGVWNQAFTPASDAGQFNSLSGSVLFTAGGKIYRTRGNNDATSPMIRKYTPPAGGGTGTWAAAGINTFTGGSFNYGAQSAVNPGSSVVYISRGGGVSNINWWQYSGTNQNNFTFRPAGTTRNLGIGSGIAFTTTPNRIWVVYRNGSNGTTPGDGVLYYLANPGTQSGTGLTFTSAGVQPAYATGGSYYGRLASFKNAAGTEFLAYIGTDSGGASDTSIISNLSGTAAKLDLDMPPFSGALGDGCDLKWDGVPGGYLYAVRGGTDSAIARMAIPETPTVAANWDGWTPITNLPANAAAGSAITFAQTLPAPYSGTAYWSQGTIQSTEITAPGSLSRWGTLDYTADTPAGTSLNVKVQGSSDGGGSWSDLATATSSPYDLSGISTTYSRLRLVGVFNSDYITLVNTLFSQDTTTQFNLDVKTNTKVSDDDGDGAAMLTTHTVGYGIGSAYGTTGTIQSTEITASGQVTRWGHLDYTAQVPADTTFTVKVQGSPNGSTWTDVATATSSPYDLSGISITYKSLRLIGQFSSKFISLITDVFAQTTIAQFNKDTFTHTTTSTADGDGAAVLATHTVAYGAGTYFWNSGTVQSVVMTAPVEITRWGTLDLTATIPADTTLTVGVQGSPDGVSNWSGITTVTASGGANSFDLSGVSTANKGLRLVAGFASKFVSIVTNVFAQDTVAQFNRDTFTRTATSTADGDGAAVLATHTVAYGAGTYYWSNGTLQSVVVTAPAESTGWGSFDMTAQVPANTTLTVNVQGSPDGVSNWSGITTITANTGANSFDLSGVSLTTKGLRLIAQYSSKFVSVVSTLFSQDTVAQFSADAFDHTATSTADGDGAAVLATHTALVPTTPGNYLFYMRQASTSIDDYNVATGVGGTWDGDFAPTADTGFTSDTGSTLFNAGGTLYRTRGNGSTTSPQIRAYAPPAGSGSGSWNPAPINTFTGGAFSTGSQAAVNAVDSVAYINRGGGSGVINWWQYSGTTQSSMTFRYSGFNTGLLGAGSGLAYTPVADRLWVVYRNGASGDGDLYYLDAPGTKTGNQTFTNVGAMANASGTNTYYGRLAAFQDADGNEYVAYIGRDTQATSVYNTMIAYNVGGTPTIIRTGDNPFGVGASLYDGCDLVWDGVPGGYLYAIQGNGATAVRRMQIPADPTVAGNWGTWTAITNLPAGADSGSALAFAEARPKDFVSGPSYWATGTVTSTKITAPAELAKWGSLDCSAQVPADATLTVRVQGSTNGGTTWSDVATVSAVSGANTLDLSAVSIANKDLRLIGLFESKSITGTTEVFSQTTQTDFSPADTLWQTVTNATGDGAVALQTHQVTTTPSAQKFLFAHNGGETAFDAYDAATDTWNAVANGWNPTDYNNAVANAPGTGSSSYVAGSRVYVTQGNPGTPSTAQWVYTPPAAGGANGSWTTTQTLPSTIGVGSDSAVNTRAADVCVYVTRGNYGTSNNTIMWWKYGTGNTGSFTIENSGGTNLNQGAGSAIAYAPGVNRLFVVNRNGTSATGDGDLYYLANPGTPNAVARQFVQGPGVVYGGTTSTRYNAMCNFSVNNTEALAIIGRDGSGTTGVNNLIIVTRLGNTTPVVTNVGKYPFGGDTGDGVKIAWDGAGYLYAIRGGGFNEIERIAIPSNPEGAANWTTINWEPLAPPPFGTFDAGSSLAFQNATPPAYQSTQYWNFGTVLTQAIGVPGTVAKWNTLTFNTVTPSLTSVAVNIEGTKDGTNWEDVTTVTVSPADLTTISPTYQKLRLVGGLTTADPVGATPLLTDWKVDASFIEPTASVVTARLDDWSVSGSLDLTSCASATPRIDEWTVSSSMDLTTCAVATPRLDDWAVSSSVDLTTSAYESPRLDEWAVTANIDETNAAMATAVLSDWSVTAKFDETSSASTTPRLDNWSVTSVYGEFQASGGLACVNCHNAHSVQKGTANAWQVSRASDPGNTLNSPATMTDFCLGCHTSAGNQPAYGVSASSIVPYALTFRGTTDWPLFPGWDKSTGAIGFKSTGHYATTGTKALCQNCHDPHGSDYANLTAWTKPSNFAAGLPGSRDNTSTGARESNLCFQCHGNSTVNVAGFTGRTATGTAGMSMDVAIAFGQARSHPASMTGVHSDKETTATLGAGNRHAECVDCHDPHAAQHGTHTTGTAEAGPALYGATGVKPTFPAAQMSDPSGYQLIRLDGTDGDFEAYLCFKCHSSNVRLAGVNSPSGKFQETNIAAEFNPNNASGHNVMGDAFTKAWTDPNGTGWTWFKPTTASLGLGNGWTVDMEMTCSDCHSYNGAGSRGPHGSANLFITKGGSPTVAWWSVRINDWNNAANMCNKCHTTQPHGSWWNEESDHYIACEGCHIRIPHGWKRPRLLANHNQPLTDNLPYVDPNVEGDTGVRNSQTDNNLGESDCLTNCGEHSNSGTRW